MCLGAATRHASEGCLRSRVSRHDTHQGHLKWSCGRRAFGKRCFDQMSFDSCTCRSADHLNPTCKGNHQRHNNRGHSYLSRFLIAAIPSKLYNRNKEALPSLLKQAAGDLRKVFEEGILHERSGKRFRLPWWALKATQNGISRPALSIGRIIEVVRKTMAPCAHSVMLAPKVLVTQMCLMLPSGIEASADQCHGKARRPSTRHHSLRISKPTSINLILFMFSNSEYSVSCWGATIVRLALMGYIDFDDDNGTRNIVDRLSRGSRSTRCGA